MADASLQVDPALQAEFIDESLDMLNSLDSRFVELETNPTDLSIVGAIFRPVHSIKGNSGFFGFLKVKTLAHELENLLDQVRKEQLSVTAELITILLQGMDKLKDMFLRVREEQPEIDDEKAFDQFVQTVKQAGAGQASSQAWTTLLDRLSALAGQVQGQVEGVDQQFAELIAELTQLSPLGDSEATDTPQLVPPAVQLIRDILKDPIADQLEEAKVKQIGEALQKLINEEPDPEAHAIVVELFDTFETFSQSVGFDGLLAEIVLEKLDSFVHALPAPCDQKEMSTKSTESDAAAETSGETSGGTFGSGGTSGKKKVPAAKHVESQKTMRVSESHIDTFLEYVGELLVVGDMYANVQLQMVQANLDSQLIQYIKRTNETFGTLSQNLQKSIMSIRKVRMGSLLQKVPRLVRDIATKSGKRIEVTITGEDTEVDKSLIDLFDAPLTHMVRNASDHGVETPDIRQAAGKTPEGHVAIDVSETPTHIVLTVSDDGAGLNMEKIQAKAESMGLVQPGETLTHEQVVNFIFSSGVSTAEEVTDVSGRGVGMDVVKRMIEEAGGNITVQTHAGEGSHFVIELPKSVTTQIMQAYMVRIGQRKYVLPMNKVHETACIDLDQIKTITGKGRCIVRHDKIYPLIDLSQVLGMTSRKAVRPDMVAVTVESAGTLLAVAVDDVLGVQQVVLRTIEGLTIESDLIVGGALMGDSSVALVVNTECLASAHSRQAA